MSSTNIVQDFDLDTDLDLAVVEQTLDAEVPPLIHTLLRAPAAILPKTEPDEVRLAINEYFSSCQDHEIRPGVCGLALSLGLPSISSIQRLGRRRPQLRQMLGMALVAVQYGYEIMLGFGSTSGLIYALNNIPDGFDIEEAEGSPSPQFWKTRNELEVNTTIAGVVGVEVMGKDITPEEAYARIIEGKAVRIPQEQQILENVGEEAPGEFERPSWLNEELEKGQPGPETL